MSTVNLRWVAASDADVDTDYRIEYNNAAADEWDVLVTQNSANRGDGSYSPYATTLSGDIAADATTIVLASGTNFAEGDYVSIGRNEMVLLGAKATATYTGCTRGIGGSLPVAHLSGVAVEKAHESYTHSAYTFPAGRYVIRYRAIRVQGTDQGVAVELTAVNPPVPHASHLCCVYGLLEDANGNPVSGVQVRLDLNENDNFGPDSGDVIYGVPVTVTTDDDGFWYHFIRRDISRSGAGVYTLLIAPGSEGELSWTIGAVPDADSIHFLET